MGTTFKSIYLGQGRADAQKMKQLGKLHSFSLSLENPDLKKIHKVLLQLVERPEENLNEFFLQDIYTSPLFKGDTGKSISSDNTFK